MIVESSAKPSAAFPIRVLNLYFSEDFNRATFSDGDTTDFSNSRGTRPPDWVPFAYRICATSPRWRARSADTVRLPPVSRGPDHRRTACSGETAPTEGERVARREELLVAIEGPGTPRKAGATNTRTMLVGSVPRDVATVDAGVRVVGTIESSGTSWTGARWCSRGIAGCHHQCRVGGVT